MADLPTVQRSDDAFTERVERSVSRSLFAARWIMAPVYFGLMAALVLDVIKFMQKLVTAVPEILKMDTSETILTVLTLIDLSLVGNLIVIVVFAGWANFAPPKNDGQKSAVLPGLDFSAVKMKLIGSIAAIAAIQILETFVHIDNVSKTDAMWQLAILFGIGITGVLLAVMDRLSVH